MSRGRGARSRDAWGRCIRCAWRSNGDIGLEGHAAGGTGAGLGLAHFGAHGADVRGRTSGFRLPGYEYGPRSGDGGHSERYETGRCGLIQIRLGIGFEFFDAAGAAEVIFFSGVFVDVFCGCRIDIHSANGVALGRGGRCHRYRVSVLSPLQGLLNFSCYNTHSLRCAAFCRRCTASLRWLPRLSRRYPDPLATIGRRSFVDWADARCIPPLRRWITDGLYWIHHWIHTTCSVGVQFIIPEGRRAHDLSGSGVQLRSDSGRK